MMILVRVGCFASLFVCSAFVQQQQQQPSRATRRSAENNNERWGTEFAEFVSFNSGRWRGEAVGVTLDPVLRRGRRDKEVDGKKYLALIEHDDDFAFDETCFWDAGADVVEDRRRGKDLACHHDGSYSVDHAQARFYVDSPFATELSVALSNNDRVRVVVGYDEDLRLCRAMVLDEARVDVESGDPLVARVGDVKLDDLVGEWRGDATVRFLQTANLMVGKQDLFFKATDSGFSRNLRIVGMPDSEDLPGKVVPQRYRNEHFQLANFLDDTALLVFKTCGVYVLAPWSLAGDESCLVEAGVVLDERTDVQNAQFPISFREGDELGVPASTSTRFLSRSVRLFDRRDLVSVIHSYHQFQE